jgi:hypothetical protein
MSEECSWLHEQLAILPLYKFPFNLKELPDNGIYFFYERNEDAIHIQADQTNSKKISPRIVRIGTHKEGNFRSRISEHFLLNESRMNFSNTTPKPSDRSIFRKNIGRALLNKYHDDYLEIWGKDFTSKSNRLLVSSKRDIKKEKEIEQNITKIIRENFSFKFIELEEEKSRIGSTGLESRLIGTVARCKPCGPTNQWLGKFCPIPKIRDGKLLLIQHIQSPIINDIDKKSISNKIS